MVFWLIFSIMGYQFFGGKFYRCISNTGVKYNASFIPNKEICLRNATTNGNRWVNSKIHFNSAFTGFLALFQVVRLKDAFIINPFLSYLERALYLIHVSSSLRPHWKDIWK
jgi:hypothetical protein